MFRSGCLGPVWASLVKDNLSLNWNRPYLAEMEYRGDIGPDPGASPGPPSSKPDQGSSRVEAKYRLPYVITCLRS